MEGMTPQRATYLVDHLKKEHGMKQYQIAEQLGCTSKCLSSWRKGNNIGRVLAQRLLDLVDSKLLQNVHRLTTALEGADPDV